ncbi:MAG: exodeoxyribonuclease III [Anaerolineales bacterium]|jgi:exodeoxyribonuclease-3
MKIISWNVNGLRANIRNNGVDWIISQNPDVICLQEIRARPDQLKPDLRDIFDQYKLYWNPAERPGYSGVAIFTAVRPKEIRYGIGDNKLDGEGRLIMSRFEDFWLLNIYAPNGRRDHSRVKFKLDFYAKLLKLCDKLHHEGEKVVLCGDLNTAHKEIDLKKPKSNLNTSGFLPEERAWIERFLDHGLVDIYRNMFPDGEKYTWWTYRYTARGRNIGWRLDYFFVSLSLVSQIQDTSIDDDVMGSDHCPITLIIDS